jgi:hypothetical protein
MLYLGPATILKRQGAFEAKRAAPTLEQVVFREAPSSPERLSVNGSAKAGVDTRRPSGDGVLDMGELERIKNMAENDDEAGGTSGLRCR